MYVLNAIVKAIGRINVTHEPSRYGGVIIVIRSLKRNNKLNVMNVHAGLAGTRAEVVIATDAGDLDTGLISVTHVFRDVTCLKIK